jgi:hypothetical protein
MEPAGSQPVSILLLNVDGGWVAHLLDYDLVGEGRTMLSAVQSVRAAYEWCGDGGRLNDHPRANETVWKVFRDSPEVSYEEILHQDARERHAPSRPIETLGTLPAFMIHKSRADNCVRV